MLERLHVITGRRAYDAVPERVRVAITRQQESSELLISWVQLAVVVTFATLYALSPKTFDPQAMIAPVPWALAIYLSFTLLRLGLALARRLPAWFLMVSALADILLLLGLIWSFHVQYEQPPSFYLKVPTLLYVFIFIALRTLQFRVRYLLVTGVAAAAGWLGLAWYAIATAPGGQMLTRDYVEYMTSNSILLGAEFDKVVSILMVTAILAMAMTRARSLLVTSVVEAATARDLSRFVPNAVVRRAQSDERGMEAGQGEVREASILFLDMEGFTALSERLGPERLIATLNEYFAVVSTPIVSHGGIIGQFQGDAVLATFNVPETLADHAGHAVAAALEIQAALARHDFGGGLRLSARIGINTGIVVGGLVGGADRLSYTVHGDEVNLAARLEQLNKELGTGILVTDGTRVAAGTERFAFRRLGTVPVRGRTVPAEVYAVGDPGSRTPADP